MGDNISSRSHGLVSGIVVAPCFILLKSLARDGNGVFKAIGGELCWTSTTGLESVEGRGVKLLVGSGNPLPGSSRFDVSGTNSGPDFVAALHFAGAVSG